MIINKDSVKAIRQKLDDTAKKQEVIAEVRNMLEIKSTLRWRADAGTCCGSLCSISSSLTREISLLEEILSALEQGDDPHAVSLLQEYEHVLETDYGCESQKHC